ncbi:CvpA family protein [Enterococcus saccharolyticus]|uniref:Colicin V production protein CvpA n=1 Tax=Candidatus Enterococcus willemsii TaxID=1857215 RepID=A0ABQ6Z181_9ENTE|nr:MULTISPECIES: CvpA family protein [Enterococcus]KAF1305118.1 colicin V production protein CvpA [Enterococcus sp. CU12B]MCD5002507.1 CvpA family protein [Enterococcus saccharolyticus]
MIGLAIFLLVLFAFYEGARRGTALQLIYLVGFILSFFIAKEFYQPLGEKIELYVPYLSVSPDTQMALYSQEVSFDLDKAYYAGVAFIGLVFAGWLVTKFIGILFGNLRFYKLFPYDWILSGVMNTLIIYTIIFMVLFALTTLPIGVIQNQFTEGLPKNIVEHTPILSNFFQKIWITDIIQ